MPYPVGSSHNLGQVYGFRVEIKSKSEISVNSENGYLGQAATTLAVRQGQTVYYDGSGCRTDAGKLSLRVCFRRSALFSLKGKLFGSRFPPGKGIRFWRRLRWQPTVSSSTGKAVGDSLSC
ncbi:MAG: hypothetical protein ABSG91_25215 [Syntrophobacteraceae bacterium]